MMPTKEAEAGELRDKIIAVCVGLDTECVSAALLIVLVRAIEQLHDCTPEQAADHIINSMNRLKQQEQSDDQPDTMLQ